MRMMFGRPDRGGSAEARGVGRTTRTARAAVAIGDTTLGVIGCVLECTRLDSIRKGQFARREETPRLYRVGGRTAIEGRPRRDRAGPARASPGGRHWSAP